MAKADAEKEAREHAEAKEELAKMERARAEKVREAARSEASAFNQRATAYDRLASPVTKKSKRDRLKELLELYKGDKITPKEYHRMRSKILSEPEF